MKYKTFSLIRRIIIIIIAIIAILWLFNSLCSKSKNNKLQNKDKEISTVENTKNNYGKDFMTLTSIDKLILEYQKKDISDGKIDDQGDSYKKFITTKDFKVDLRCDFKKGYSYWNRIKVDFDKDKKWDEKWSFQKDGTIKKEVSPNDDENYEYSYILNGDKWERK